MKAEASLSETAFLKTIIDTILEAEALLANARVTETPRLEAEVLLADTLGIGREKVIASYSEPMEHSAEYFSRVARRTRGEPLAYITGRKEFMGFTFRVDNRALIPRPETETLVEYAVRTVGAERRVEIVDIGTGCGCIAVSLALLMPHASIHAVDISEGAVELARHNAGRHGVGSRIALHIGNLYCALPQSLKGRVDVIVSNPPYVSDAEHAVLDRSIRDFEPALALRGGRDGLDVFGRIAAGAADFLTGGGLLASEIGESQAEKATAILETIGSFVEIETVRDLGGRSRVMTGRKRT